MSPKGKVYDEPIDLEKMVDFDIRVEPFDSERLSRLPALDWSAYHETQRRAMLAVLSQYEGWLKKHNAKTIEFEHLASFYEWIDYGMSA